MLIQAIKIDFLPNFVISHIDQGTPENTINFMDVFNSISQGFLKLIINRQVIFEFSGQDLMPNIKTDWELINSTGPVYKIIHSIESSRFTPFKDLVGVESHFVREDDEVHCQLELPGALTYAEPSNNPVVSNTLKLRVSLLTRPQRKPYVG